MIFSLPEQFKSTVITSQLFAIIIKTNLLHNYPFNGRFHSTPGNPRGNNMRAAVILSATEEYSHENELRIIRILVIRLTQFLLLKCNEQCFTILRSLQQRKADKHQVLVLTKVPAALRRYPEVSSPQELLDSALLTYQQPITPQHISSAGQFSHSAIFPHQQQLNSHLNSLPGKLNSKMRQQPPVIDAVTFRQACYHMLHQPFLSQHVSMIQPLSPDNSQSIYPCLDIYSTQLIRVVCVNAFTLTLPNVQLTRDDALNKASPN